MRPPSPTPMQESDATWLDPRTGVREAATFFGAGRLKRFGCLRVPHGAAIAGVVICPPTYEDYRRIYRKEVLLARALAAQGIAAFRFDYRGFGNSDGEIQDTSFNAMMEDALEAVEWLQRRIGVERIALMGARWGGLIAAGASRITNAPLSLWEPVLDPDSYFREAFRARLVRSMHQGADSGSGPQPPGDPFREELDRDGFVDLHGWPIGRTLYQSALGRRLEEELGEHPRPVLLVQLGRGRELRPDYATLGQRLAGRGFLVESDALDGDEAWWFTALRWESEETRGATQRLVQGTADWIARHVGWGAE